MRKIETGILLLLLAVAALVRCLGCQTYFPLLSDEAKYLSEVEGIIPHFSVNVGAFAFLKLGHSVFGGTAYPQVVTAIFGMLAVFGLWLLGRQLFAEHQHRGPLGLLMAGQGAVLPYLVNYSYHAMPTIFALTFFIYALYFYVLRLRHRPNRDRNSRLRYLRTTLTALLLMACVPACSFKFLLPTALIVFCCELYTLRVFVGDDRPEKRRYLHYGLLSITASVILMVAVPVLLSLIAGYDGWWQRAIQLSDDHAAIRTMRPAFHFTFPLHLFYLAGIPFMVLSGTGTMLLFARRGTNTDPPIIRSSATIVLLGALINVIFFGAFSHLQGSRLYVLTLPFLIFAAAVALLYLARFRQWYGRAAGIGAALILFGSLGVATGHLATRTSYRQTVYDEALANLKFGQGKAADAVPQFIYGIHHSPVPTSDTLEITSLVRILTIKADSLRSRVNIMQDAGYLVALLGMYDKRDQPLPLETAQDELRRLKRLTATGKIIAVFPDTYSATPPCYLENLYSWRSYRCIKELLAECRDSIYIFY